MPENSRRPVGRECPPSSHPLASQPKPVCIKEKECCDPLYNPPEPPFKEPHTCPELPECCKCPEKPTVTSTCLEDEIANQASAILAGDRAGTFKKDLEALLTAANAAAAKYTRDKYKWLLDQWKAEDAAIVELLHKVTCSVHCWKCIIECEVCPLLFALRDAEQALYGDDLPHTDIKDLYDRQYWRMRDRDSKKRRYSRINDVLTAWSSPADNIGKALTTNSATIKALCGYIGCEPGKAIYDLFLRVVPLHLAIAPPVDTAKTGIAAEFTIFCEEDTGVADDCCGPDVGKLSVRRRLIGAQPYLIDPNEYFALICCLVRERYAPAKESWTKAEADFAAVTAEIKRYEDRWKEGWIKTLDTAARGAIPSVIDCRDYMDGAETSESY
jgi:hypothetical protein